MKSSSPDQRTRKGWAVASAFAALALLTAGWIVRDYRAWLRLGPGGLPSTPQGWLRMTRWRLQIRNPFDISTLRALQDTPGDRAFLTHLRRRARRRPSVAPHPVPHRQLDQRSDTRLLADLQALFDRAVTAHGAQVRYAMSHFERHTPAITRLACLGAAQGEIAHIHAIDGSMHMILSPSDTITALEAGWGELHGLAGRTFGLPATYMLVYAPGSPEDLEAISGLLEAAISFGSSDHPWVCGVPD